jgi:hypothetical protein
MSLPDELQSLAALKAKGALSEQEFAQAKAAVIAKYGGTSTATPVASASKTSGLMRCLKCGRDAIKRGDRSLSGHRVEMDAPDPDNPLCSDCHPCMGWRGY